MKLARLILIASVALLIFSLGIVIAVLIIDDNPATETTTIVTAAPSPSLPEETAYIGTYYLGSGVNDPFGPPVYVLTLAPEATVKLTVYPTDPNEPIETYNGLWEQPESQAIVTFTEKDGQPLEELVRVVFEFRDLFLVAVEHPFGEEQFEFTIGSGDDHPAVRLLHQRLAAVPWLAFTDPGPSGTIYDAETRRAITDFQISQGLPPSGVVDQQTWDALQNPVPPAPTAEPPTAAPTRGPVDLPGSVAERPTHIDGQPVLYLTFDDGPSRYTPQILEVLARHNAWGTFFVIGQNVSAQPEITGEAAGQGHGQANHTYTHTSLQGLSQTQFSDEINRTKEAIQAATGGQDLGRTKLLCLRPPYGATDDNTRTFAAELGYEVVMWDVDPQDWRQPGADQIADHVIANVRPGAIILMHDGGGYRDQTLAALETSLQSLSAQGYRFEALCR